MDSIKKRFVAGAVCPECKTEDRIVLYRIDDLDYRECIQCGFKDQMHFKSPPRELETRVNVPVEQKNAETQVVKIINIQSDQSK
jgi:uncharacterized protein